MREEPEVESRVRAAPVISVALYAQLVATGMTTYGMGVFLKPVAEAFGSSRLAVSAGATIFTVTAGCVAPIVGRLVDRWGVRPVMLSGALWLGLGTAAMGATGALWQIGILLVIGMGVGATCAGTIPSNTLVVRRFSPTPARALGIVATGSSLGGVVVPPLAAALLVAVGWRGALAVLGFGAALTLAPLVGWLVPGRDSSARLPPLGSPASGKAPSAANALRVPAFWLIALAIGILYSTNTALLVHVIPFATDLGIETQRAAVLVSLFAAASVAGKLAYSAVGGRFDVRAPLFMAALIQLVSLPALTLAPRFATLACVVVLNGLGTGAVLPTWSALIAACFETERFGEILGWMRLFTLPIMNIGLLFTARVRDVTGVYTLAWLALAATAVLAGLLPLWLRVPSGARGSGGSKAP